MYDKFAVALQACALLALALAASRAQAAPEGRRRGDDDGVVPILDMIPAVSQVKTLAEWIFQDLGYASRTTSNFLNDGIGTSQARSAYFLLTGDVAKAVDIQKKFGRSVLAAVDYLPVVGHVKAGIELLNGHEDLGWKTFGRASWPVTVTRDWINAAYDWMVKTPEHYYA